MNGGGKSEHTAPLHHEAVLVMILKSGWLTLAFVLIIAIYIFMVQLSATPIASAKVGINNEPVKHPTIFLNKNAPFCPNSRYFATFT